LATAFGANNTVPTFLSANGPIREARFKFTSNGTRDGGVHSLFVISGRVDSSGSAAGCTAVQENFNAQYRASNVALRIPTPTYGLGLVENIPDTTLTANLAANRAQKSQLGISGHLNTNDNDGRVARYGWKAQNVSLLLFSGEAYNVEEGITNELFQTERDLTSTCQLSPVPNDVTGKLSPLATGTINSDITNFATYMRFLAPPAPSTTTPGGATSIANGQKSFSSIGCSMCHTPALKTDNTTVAALANQTAALYSDLALHQMGPGLADNIQQGAAAGDEFRTAPLWGLGQRIFFLHDGRTSDLVQAIQDHASGGSAGNSHGGGWSSSQFGPSEANRVIANYNALNTSQQQDLLNFLRSL
ncbi:MAG TPA: di-heme oxidoredictase family protein, partial [Steroidobacteraceae bacterium]